LPSREDDAIRLRVVIRPMVSWIWTGGGIMVLGTILALVPASRRRQTNLSDPTTTTDSGEGNSRDSDDGATTDDTEPELIGG
ncbi:MAG: hypothetical protein GY724_16795, partial [Actinomycetia bacterium]|nr:hypothetical protein [Actinomycetes bacterium]